MGALGNAAQFTSRRGLAVAQKGATRSSMLFTAAQLRSLVSNCTSGLQALPLRGPANLAWCNQAARSHVMRQCHARWRSATTPLADKPPPTRERARAQVATCQPCSKMRLPPLPRHRRAARDRI